MLNLNSFSTTGKQYQLKRILNLIVYKKTDEWYIEWQRITASDNVWYNEWQRMTTSGTISDNEWCNEWQRVTISANFFFQIREEPTTKDPKENFKHWKGPLKKAYWIKSRNKPLRRNINSKKEE